MTHKRQRPDNARDPFQWITVACVTGKRAFPTKAQANAAREQSRRQLGKKLSAYRCDNCDYFHLGTLPAQVKRGVLDRRDIIGPSNN